MQRGKPRISESVIKTSRAAPCGSHKMGLEILVPLDPKYTRKKELFTETAITLVAIVVKKHKQVEFLSPHENSNI